jgi:PhnB protein
MGLTAHVSYSGRCREAFTFYAQLFDGELMMLAYRDTPMANVVSPEWIDKIVHATLSFDGCQLAGSDVQSDQFRIPQGFSVLVDVEGAENARRIFAALSEGGSIGMSMQETFWSPAFGVLTDRFGIPWEINGKPSREL